MSNLNDKNFPQPENTEKTAAPAQKTTAREWWRKGGRTHLRKALTNNLALKILSVVFAIIIWAVIMAQTNPPRKKIVYNIPVEISGLATMSQRGLALSEMPELLKDTVDVTLEVPMDDLSKVNIDNVTASVDFSKITDVGEYDLKINLSSVYGTPLSATQSVVPVSIESLVTSYVPVKLKFEGALDATHRQGKATLTPTQIKISGPETEVNRVSSAQVVIDLDGLKEEYSQSEVYTLVDENGMPVEYDGFTMDVGNSVSVLMPVYPIKDVSVAYESSISGMVKEGYYLEKVEVLPATVRIAADEKVLSTIATLSTALIDVNDLSEDTTLTVDLRKLTDVMWMDVEQVDVKLTIREEQITKTFRYVPIAAINLAQGMSVNTYNAMADITVTGPRSQMEKLTRDQIHASIDLAECGPGTGIQTVAVTIDDMELYSVQLAPDSVSFMVKKD